MKSPWKFLAQFIPQRRSAEPRASSIGNDPDTERSQNEAQQSSGLPLDATEAPRGPERDKSRPIELLTTSTANHRERGIGAGPGVSERVDAEESHAPARGKPLQSTARSRALRMEREPNKKSPQTPLTNKLERAKSTDVAAKSAAVANRDRAARALSSRDAFLDEVGSLDEDIKQLRIQLARKLHLQNVQLKKMLERFDVS